MSLDLCREKPPYPGHWKYKSDRFSDDISLTYPGHKKVYTIPELGGYTVAPT